MPPIFREGVVECPDSKGVHRLVYSDWGAIEAKHIVVCVHGLTRNGHDFDRLAQKLIVDKNIRVLCPDMAGRLRSDALTNSADYAIPQYLSDIQLMLRHAGVPAGEIDWVGTSMGGLIALAHCITASESGQNWSIRRLVLNDVGPFLEQNALKRIAEYCAIPWHFKDYDEAIAHIREIYQPFGIRGDEDWKFMAEISLKPHQDGGYVRSYDPALSDNFKDLAKSDLDLWPFWERATMPILLIRGIESDLLSNETACKMVETGYKVRYLTLDGCGHAPSLFYEDQIKPIVDFLGNETP